MKWDMKPTKRNKKVMLGAEMVFTLLYMIESMTYFRKYIVPGIEKDIRMHIFAAFGYMGLAKTMRILANRYREPVLPCKRLDGVSCAACFACALLLLVGGSAPWTHQLACVVFLVSLLARMALSVALNRKPTNILLNLAAAGFVVYFTFELWQSKWAWIGRGQVMEVAAFAALIDIFVVVFIRIRVDILRKILHRTFAAEILFGLVLLVLALGYWLYAAEEGITSYLDALWYCFAIVTTIGFGDFAAASVEGRIISVILGSYGIIVVALVTSVIVNYYGEMKKEEAERRVRRGHGTGYGRDDLP